MLYMRKIIYGGITVSPIYSKIIEKIIELRGKPYHPGATDERKRIYREEPLFCYVH